MYFKKGETKLCVSVCESDTESILKEATSLFHNDKIDMVEWRVDFYENCFEKEDVTFVLEALSKIKKDKKLIFTFRTLDEGGNKECSIKEYETLCKNSSLTNTIDYIDIEVARLENMSKTFMNDIKTEVILSNHNFKETPSNEDIEDILQRMNTYHPCVSKLAYMPNSEDDVARLISIVQKVKTNVVCISMGTLGQRTRLDAKAIGSCFTFASANKESAPGQPSIDELYSYINA